MELAAFCAESAKCIEIADLCAQHVHGLLRCLRHKGSQQGYTHGDALHQVVKHCGKALFLCLIAAQDPGLGLIDIFVEAFENSEDLGQGIRCTELIHLLLHLAVGCSDNSFEIFIKRLRLFCFLVTQACK